MNTRNRLAAIPAALALVGGCANTRVNTKATADVHSPVMEACIQAELQIVALLTTLPELTKVSDSCDKFAPETRGKLIALEGSLRRMGNNCAEAYADDKATLKSIGDLVQRAIRALHCTPGMPNVDESKPAVKPSEDGINEI
ncbi:hypothetical protein HZA42_04745 [Candidatus Peregrinibacteria bacterium]|nr:hypothetical protein [Candidatus Peregrinibacteria bacterium]